MPGQLNLMIPPRSPPLNALANDPFILNQPQSCANQLPLSPPAQHISPVKGPVQQPSCPYIAPLLHSVQVPVWSQNHVKTDFRQPNTFGFSTGTAPTFVAPIVCPLYEASVPSPLCYDGPQHPTPSSPSLDSGDSIQQ